MTDIVTRLRGECQCSDDCRAVGDPCIPMRAADEIERLRADVTRWSNWAIDYACDDTKCECDRCVAVRAAWEATVNGNR